MGSEKSPQSYEMSATRGAVVDVSSEKGMNCYDQL